MVIDDLTDGTKFVNLVDLTIADYMDRTSSRRGSSPVTNSRSGMTASR